MTLYKGATCNIALLQPTWAGGGCLSGVGVVTWKSDGELPACTAATSLKRRLVGLEKTVSLPDDVKKLQPSSSIDHTMNWGRTPVPQQSLHDFTGNSECNHTSYISITLHHTIQQDTYY